MLNNSRIIFFSLLSHFHFLDSFIITKPGFPIQCMKTKDIIRDSSITFVNIRIYDQKILFPFTITNTIQFCALILLYSHFFQNICCCFFFLAASLKIWDMIDCYISYKFIFSFPSLWKWNFLIDMNFLLYLFISIYSRWAKLFRY